MLELLQQGGLSPACDRGAAKKGSTASDTHPCEESNSFSPFFA